MFISLSDTRLGGVAVKSFIVAFSSLMGYFTQIMEGAASPSWRPIIASVVAVAVFSLFGAMVKIYGLRVGLQTKREERESSDIALVINELKALVAQKDAHHETAMAELRRHYEEREELIRQDRHKFRGRTQLCMARLSNLHGAGKLTFEEATIDFEKYEQATELASIADIHTTAQPGLKERRAADEK
jgi:hypothetical protein